MENSVETNDAAVKRDFVLIHPDIIEIPVSGSNKPFLKAGRCNKCGQIFFPKRDFCRYCDEEGSIDQIALCSRGVVYASTVVHVDSPVGIKAPYAIGYVDLKDDDHRVFALFTGADPSSIKPGDEVELVIEFIGKNKEQKSILGYKYRPVR
jgi:uncharacterized OB-fold protein